jgi:hypothetical protein
MATQRRQKPQGWSERKGPCFLQSGESGETGIESPAAGRWSPERQFLRPDERDEEEAYFGEDGERPELPY